MSLLEVGTPAPDFTATGSDGQPHTLREVLRQGHALLIFYPGNNTPG